MFRRVLSGSLWMVGARWLIRGIGLASTLVLARLLKPSDFGVVAMATFVVGLIEVFGETGMVLFLVRHPNPERRHFDTVWTLRLMTACLAALALVLLAPAGAAFFDAPEVTWPIRVLALRTLLVGLENPGIVAFRRNMVFRKDFEFFVLNKVVSFLVTLGLAWWLRNHWALVVGILMGGVVSTAQSYRMHPYRPRPSLAEARAVWGLSFWILAQNVITYINSRFDQLVVGRLQSAAALGYYSVAWDLASSPLQEVVQPVGRVLEPAVARLAGQPAEMAATFGRVFAALASLIVPAGVGLSLIAHDAVRLVLGSAWAPSAPLMQVLALAAIPRALVAPITALFSGAGNPRTLALFAITRQVLLAAAVLPLAIEFGLMGAAAGQLVAASALLLLAARTASVTLGLPALALLRFLVRPMAASAAMALAVAAVARLSPDVAALRLGGCVGIGVASYAVAMVAVWYGAGRPDGPERAAADWIPGEWRGAPPQTVAGGRSAGTGGSAATDATMASARAAAFGGRTMVIWVPGTGTTHRSGQMARQPRSSPRCAWLPARKITTRVRRRCTMPPASCQVAIRSVAS